MKMDSLIAGVGVIDGQHLWRESLCLGVEVVDGQHRELFNKTEEFLKEINRCGVENKEKCISTVRFLKKYAVMHFADEEDYQQSINYQDFEAHKKQHEKFVDAVLCHEMKMAESDFAEKDVKEFAGMLVAWLLYHVADSDQKIGKKAARADVSRSHDDIMFDSVCHVLNAMAGFDVKSMKKVTAHSETASDSLAVKTEFIGDIMGNVTLVYPLGFVSKLICSMLNFKPDGIDELVFSVLFEISKSISERICGRITEDKGLTCELKPPCIARRAAVRPDERVSADTGEGVIEIDLTITYK